MNNKVKVYGSIIAELRTKRGWTQKELAEQIAEMMPGPSTVSVMLISAWETNRRRVADKYLEPLCSLFNVSEEYLCGKTLPENDDEQVMKRIKHLESMKTEISYEQLFMYHKKPVYISFDDMLYEAQWGIVDMCNKRIVTVGRSIPLNAGTKKNMKIYEYQPYYTEEYYNLVEKRMDYKSMINAERVYVIMTSMDDVVHALYDGWYTHNGSKTALRNADGNVLPYAGLGKTFNCYPI